jgi:uncharacterized protein
MSEVFLVLFTAGAFQVCERVPGTKGPFIAAASLFWVIYVVTRARRQPGLIQQWGFRIGGFGGATAASGIVLLAGATMLFAWGASVHGFGQALTLPRNFWLALLVYPLWGLVQQFLLNALFARNLVTRLPASLATIIAAALFGAIHLPDLTLAALTATAALIWVPIYLRRRNLWPLGICHGWLGAVTYYAVLRRDAIGTVLATFGM